MPQRAGAWRVPWVELEGSEADLWRSPGRRTPNKKRQQMDFTSPNLGSVQVCFVSGESRCLAFISRTASFAIARGAESGGLFDAVHFQKAGFARGPRTRVGLGKTCTYLPLGGQPRMRPVQGPGQKPQPHITLSPPRHPQCKPSAPPRGPSAAQCSPVQAQCSPVQAPF